MDNILVDFLVREITNLVETGYYKDIDGIPEFVSDFSEEELIILQEEITKDVESLVSGKVVTEEPQTVFQERVKTIIKECNYVEGEGLKQFLIIFFKHPNIWESLRREDLEFAQLKWANMCFNLIIKYKGEEEILYKGYGFTEFKVIKSSV